MESNILSMNIRKKDGRGNWFETTVFLWTVLNCFKNVLINNLPYVH